MKEIINNMKESLASKKGFISTTFLLVMCSMITVILAKSDYLYTGNSVYSNLREAEDIFEKEAYILHYTKCALLRNETLDDFYTNGIYVNVYENTNGYDLYFDDYRLRIEVYEKQIVDFDIES